jgi:hypothetical protein
MHLHIGWPQGLYLLTGFIGLGCAGWTREFGNVVIGVALWVPILGLLYWGGFFG